MIKEYEQRKIDEVMKLWLDTNINAHYFISEKYWVDNYQVVRERYLTSK
ncbi:GNAT family protein [Pelosinus propionicus]|uniref:Putative acetyltransferase n=1 Tax=Pelosinus propionicus DSM 13327 TaxID=1123291 RepID=A0A1I4M9J8_9FIRM|nr:hypothetical protein [Pelosinus propionicus]SFL99899.1 putative acetyltransferase [Pelosinus propionicus DSM 13327]